MVSEALGLNKHDDVTIVVSCFLSSFCVTFITSFTSSKQYLALTTQQSLEALFGAFKVIFITCTRKLFQLKFQLIQCWIYQFMKFTARAS